MSIVLIYLLTKSTSFLSEILSKYGIERDNGLFKIQTASLS